MPNDKEPAMMPQRTVLKPTLVAVAGGVAITARRQVTANAQAAGVDGEADSPSGTSTPTTA